MRLLERYARDMGMRLTEQHLSAFQTYQKELLEWNQRFNLTAITQENHIQIRHFLDSLTCLIALKQFSPERARGQRVDDPLSLLDIGTGAGFPGAPLKIVCPRWRVALLESTGKKVQFLEHLRGVLQIEDLEVIHGRAETVARQDEHREKYDVVVARAVAEMPVLAELMLPFARLGGVVIAMKAASAEAEVAEADRALAVLGGTLLRIIPLELPGLVEPRRLAVIRKSAVTPDAYPRRPGIPAKRPLK